MTEQAQQDSEIGEDQTGGDETAPPKDLKVVVSIKDGRATIGVQRPSSDPPSSRWMAWTYPG